MADNAEVLQQIKRYNGISYSALTPNLKGFQAAVSSSYKTITGCAIYTYIYRTYRLMPMLMK